MKFFNNIIAAFFLLSTALVSCESPDLSEGRVDQVNGLLNVTICIPGSPIEYTAVNKGPYEEGEEILVKVPTTEEEPLDVTNLLCTVSIENNCFVDPPLGGALDFTNPREISVIDVNGNRHTNTIRVKPTPPKTKFSALWAKSATDLSISSRDITGIAINDDCVAVQVFNGDIQCFNIENGDFIKSIPAASSFMMKLDVDAAGHFVSARENVYGAGFMVYYYSEEENAHKLLLNYKNDDGCPEDLGYEMSVIGDVTKGKAFIYGIAPGDMNVYYWELKDGKLVTPDAEPNKIRYGAAKANWNLAQIQRATLADDSEHYISYYQPENGSRFNIFTPSMIVTPLAPENHDYKILDFKVFTINGEDYLVTNEQGQAAWDPSLIQVFEFTNRSYLDLKPGDDGYNKFNLFKGEIIGATNYNVWGDLGIHIKETATGYDVYMAAGIVGWDTNESKIRMYKMSYYNQ